MRQYETIVIVDPDLSEEQRTPLFGRLQEIISQQGGFFIRFDDWNQRKLAYPIKKKNRGYYVRLEYCGSDTGVNELERLCRIDDRVIKYMTIVMDKTPDVESLKAAKAAADALKSGESNQPQAKTAAGSEINEPDRAAAAEPEETSTDINPEEEE